MVVTTRYSDSSGDGIGSDSSFGVEPIDGIMRDFITSYIKEGIIEILDERLGLFMRKF